MHSPWQKLKFFLQKKWEKNPDLDHTSEKVSNSKIILSKNFNFKEQRNLVCLPTLCSRNFQNVKLGLDFVEIWSFYCHSDFAWNQILGNSNSLKMSFLAILETLNFDFSKFEQLSSAKFTKNHTFGLLEFIRNWFHVKFEWQ